MLSREALLISSRFIEVVAIVEEATESAFVSRVLAPYLGYRNIGMVARQVSKPGQKGGDVRFPRVKNDILSLLKQRPDTVVTLMLDYYGLADWPGLEAILHNATPDQIERTLKEETSQQIRTLLPTVPLEYRFIPFFMIH